MKISRDNYELFFMDYFDGVMDSETMGSLFEFLEQNPDLKYEFQHFQNIRLVHDENIVFPEKETLKKQEIISVENISELNYESFFIAYFENDLNDAEKENVHAFLKKNPHLQKDFDLFHLCRIESDNNIVFNEKEKMKRAFSLLNYSTRIFRYAASIVFIAVLSYYAYVEIIKNRVVSDAFVTKICDNRNLIRQSMMQINLLNRNIKDVKMSENSFSYHPQSSNSEIENFYRNTDENNELKYFLPVLYNEIATDLFFQLPTQLQTLHEYSDILYFYAEKLKINEEIDDKTFLQNEQRIFADVIQSIKGGSDELSERLSGINVWRLAGIGVKGFNLLTNNNINYQVKNNESGQVTVITFNDFAIPVSRNR